jgi:tetratricopeptide (TPR) repeat protein
VFWIISGYVSKETHMPNSTELVHRAIDLSDAEDYRGAVNLLTQAISADSNNAQTYFERGMALLNFDQNVDAIADFDRALTIDPEFPGARDWRARTLASLGDHQRAADDRLKALRANPDGPYQGMGVIPQDWADCAESFLNAGNHNKARELLEEYFASHAKKVKSYAHFETAPMRMLAKLLIQSGDSDRACEFGKYAYSSKHQCPADVLVYALALEASGNLADARKVCAEAMEINDQVPGVKELHERLAE